MQHLVPLFDGGDSGVGAVGPMLGARVGVGFGEEAIDGDLKLNVRSEHAVFQPPLSQVHPPPQRH